VRDREKKVDGREARDRNPVVHQPKLVRNRNRPQPMLDTMHIQQRTIKQPLEKDSASRAAL